MANEYVSFDERREFLLCLGLQVRNAEEFMTDWAGVRLPDQWDLADGGACLQRSTFAACSRTGECQSSS
jgi:hypothetical protein